MNTYLNTMIRCWIGILLAVAVAVAVALPCCVAHASAHTADGAIIERTETGKWSVLIPSSRQVNSENSRGLMDSMRERLGDEQVTIRQLDDELAVLHAIDFLNELLENEYGIKLEYGENQGTYILTVYFHPTGGARIKSLQIPELLTEYDLRTLLFTREVVQEKSIDLNTPLDNVMFHEGGCTRTSCRAAREWESYVWDMIDSLCGTNSAWCIMYGVDYDDINFADYISVAGWYRHIDDSSDFNYLYREFPIYTENQYLLCYHFEWDTHLFDYKEFAETEAIYEFFLVAQDFEGFNGKDMWMLVSGKNYDSADIIASESADDSITLGWECGFPRNSSNQFVPGQTYY